MTKTRRTDCVWLRNAHWYPMNPSPSEWIAGSCTAISFNFTHHILNMQIKHWFRRLFPVAWTTATHCSLVSWKDCWTSFRTSGYWYTRPSHHITPVLCHLHWLLVCQLVHFKIVTLVHWSLSGIVPQRRLLSCHWCLRATMKCGLTVKSPLTQLTIISSPYWSEADQHGPLITASSIVCIWILFI